MTKEQNRSDLTFEAAYLGLDSKELEKGRHFIANLIAIGFAKPIISVDYTKKEIKLDETRYPGETETIYKQSTIMPQKFEGCILPDKDNDTFIVIDNTTLNIGIFKIIEFWKKFKKTTDNYLNPSTNFMISALDSGSDLISHFIQDTTLEIITTSKDNPTLVLEKVNELLPKIKEKNEVYKQNLNLTLKGFNQIMDGLFPSS